MSNRTCEITTEQAERILKMWTSPRSKAIVAGQRLGLRLVYGPAPERYCADDGAVTSK